MSEFANFLCNVCVCNFSFAVVVVTQPLPRDGGMAEDHGALEAGKLSRAWDRGRRETENC